MARGPGWKAIGLSVAAHVLIGAPLAVFARPPEPIEFETIRIQLVSPPPAQVVQPEPQPAAVQPQPEPEEPEPEPTPVVEEAEPEPEEREPEPEQDIERPPDTEKPPETPPESETRSDEQAAEDSAAAGGDNLNIRTEGREFPYPDYIENVLVQVNRYFRWSDSNRPKGVVYFEIQRDGSVRNIRMYTSSGNIRFDFAVQGAVETAGNRGAFGPLPEGFVAPVLPVTIEVEPPR